MPELPFIAPTVCTPDTSCMIFMAFSVSASVSTSSEPSGMVMVALIWLEDMLGIKIIPMVAVLTQATTSNATAASSVTARWDRHQRRTFSYQSVNDANRLWETCLFRFSMVEPMAGTTVSATTKDADSE